VRKKIKKSAQVKQIKKEKQSVLLRPQIFLILWVISIIPWIFIYFFFPVFINSLTRIDPGLVSVQKLIFYAVVLLIESVVFVIYSGVLEIVKPEHFKRSERRIFEILSIILIVIFFSGLLYFAINLLQTGN